MTTVEVLKEARRKIYRKKNWTQGAYARDKNGELLASDDFYAISWCAMGAIHNVASKNRELNIEYIRDYLYRAAHDLYNDRSVTVINDHKGHAAVLKMYAVAIEKAKNAEG